MSEMISVCIQKVVNMILKPLTMKSDSRAMRFGWGWEMGLRCGRRSSEITQEGLHR